MTKYNAHAQVREKKTTRRRRKKREERQRQSGAAMPGMRILIIQRRPSTKRNSFKEKERKKEKKKNEKRGHGRTDDHLQCARTGSVCCRRASKKVLNPVDPRDSRLLLFLFLSLVPAFSDHSRVSLFYFSKMKCYSSD